MRTEKEVKEMIQKLQELKKDILKYSVFGDQNWSIIDAQMIALEYALGQREEEDLI